ncbi:glucose 1-dehydrogenase [Levilactobacillus humaensis]|uniref:glucose 1-dehydrogenase n=1 Tax=Levilactobacillus humaensis TaxID=2950375 RepID=UPI0021C3A0F0|nr:glucose 1-dehydrogenase [Levilactobacillus humaensis]
MSDRLQGKVAIITGAGSGMGAEMAKLFAAEGARVVGADINLDRLQTVVSAIVDAGEEALAVKTDVSNLADIEALFAAAKAKFGQVDILVNNAGIMDDMAPIGELTDEMWQRNFAINTNSVMYATREAVKEFLPRHTGVILNIASVGGTNGGRAGVAYTAAKHAVVGLTKNTAFMYENEGLRINAIAPGGINTNITESMTGVSQFGMGRQQQGQGLMPQIGTSEAIATAALFLVSDDAAYVNGAIVPVDGGWTTY